MDTLQLKSYKVMVIGDSCKDIFKYGSCERMSPEAPVPVFCFKYEIESDGMAGNVFNNLKALNVDAFLQTSESKIIKERYIDIKSRQHLLRTDYEERLESIKYESLKNIDIYDSLIICDYKKGTIDEQLVAKILQNYKKPIFVDSKRQDLSIFENCIIKINENEYKNLKNLPKKYELIVTLGEKGAIYNEKRYPTKEVQVFDVSGAGDSFISSLCFQYLSTKDLEDAIKFANICATSVVKKTGTSIIDLEEVKHEIRF